MPWIASPVASASAAGIPRVARAPATAPEPIPIAPGVSGKAPARSSAGRISSAASAGFGTPSAAATAAVPASRARVVAAVQPTIAAAGRAVREHASGREQLHQPRMCPQPARQRDAGGDAREQASAAAIGQAGTAPTDQPTASSATRTSDRAAASTA